MFKKLKKNNSIITNQLRSKLLVKNLYSLNFTKLIQLQLNLNKLKSFNDVVFRIFKFFKIVYYSF